MRRYFQILPAIALLLALGVLLAACGATNGGREARGGSGSGGGFVSEQAAQRVEVVADPEGLLKWTQDDYRATAGDVTFVVKNPSPSRHNFVVEGNGVKATSPTFGTGEQTYTLKGLQPGEYLIVCTVPGHREAGMVAKLIVS